MKFWSQTFVPTLKESPADAEIASHKLLVRAGLVRKLGGGLYTYMPLGLRVDAETHAVVPRGDRRLVAASSCGCRIVHPVENWEQGPRWAAAREIMFRTDQRRRGQGPEQGA